MGKCKRVHAIYNRNEVGNNSYSVNNINLVEMCWDIGISRYSFICFLLSFNDQFLKVFWGLIGFYFSTVHNVEYYQGGAAIICLCSLF